MTNSHKNIINPFLESSTLLIMTFPEIVESKDLLCGRTCAVDNVRASRKGVLGKLYEIQISPERGLRNSLKFPSYFGMEYVRPWNMGKKLLECWVTSGLCNYVICSVGIYIYICIYKDALQETSENPTVFTPSNLRLTVTPVEFPLNLSWMEHQKRQCYWVIKENVSILCTVCVRHM